MTEQQIELIKREFEKHMIEAMTPERQHTGRYSGSLEAIEWKTKSEKQIISMVWQFIEQKLREVEMQSSVETGLNNFKIYMQEITKLRNEIKNLKSKPHT